jgi:carbonic anhydrase/acetyltransferase-like protein (isoleucine patch superfamily)
MRRSDLLQMRRLSQYTKPFLSRRPSIPTSSFIAPSANVMGAVSCGPETSIWYNATVRADINEIEIGPQSNIQDGVVVHVRIIYIYIYIYIRIYITKYIWLHATFDLIME